MIIAYDDFAKVDLRSGTIVKVEVFPCARKPAYKVWVDFGDRSWDIADFSTNYYSLHF